MGGYCKQTPTAALFGDTNHAGSIPGTSDDSEPFERYAGLAPSSGPVYLEGRLILSLSFRQDASSDGPPSVPEGETLLERYRIWDGSSGSWLEGGPTALRFESADVVMRTKPQPAIAWVGALDTRCAVIDVPDFDEEGFEHNQRCDLRWRRAPVQR